MGAGFDCFLLFDLLPNSAATGVEVDKADDDFRDLFRLLLLLTKCDIDGGGGGAEMGGDGGETAIWIAVQWCHWGNRFPRRHQFMSQFTLYGIMS